MPPAGGPPRPPPPPPRGRPAAAAPPPARRAPGRRGSTRACGLPMVGAGRRMGTDANPIAAGTEGRSRGVRAALATLHPVWWLNAAIWATAVALFVGPVSGLPALHTPHVAWWWLALGFLVGERCVVH